jgi:hypothetical protein
MSMLREQFKVRETPLVSYNLPNGQRHNHSRTIFSIEYSKNWMMFARKEITISKYICILAALFAINERYETG